MSGSVKKRKRVLISYCQFIHAYLEYKGMLRSLVLGMYKFGSLNWNWSKNVGPEDGFVLGITALVKRDRRCGSFQDESTLGGNMMMAVRKSTVNKNSYCFFLFTITRKITINQVTVADLYQPL